MVEAPGHLGSTRSFETTQEALTYPELLELRAPRHGQLTVSLASASVARLIRRAADLAT